MNRLGRRMKLQSDPTIVYGLVGGKGTLGRGILRSEIERATPYNTYVIEGLPPGPIANPGRAALEAVAAPAKTKDLYFVADGTGGHAFGETYEQHLRNVARWRQIERSRDVTAAPGGPVDRVEPPPTPETRTELEPSLITPNSMARTASIGAVSPAAGRAGTPGQGGVDAVEGTARDPLLNTTWDLSSPKNVPSFGPPVAEAISPAAAKPAKARPKPRT
jgi:UPF0755 protein